MNKLKVTLDQNQSFTAYTPTGTSNHYQWLKENTNFYMKYFSKIPTSSDISIIVGKPVSCYKIIKEEGLDKRFTDFIEDEEFILELERVIAAIDSGEFTEDELEDISDIIIGELFV